MVDKTTQRIKDLKEIDIAIDTWNDIFSDFDPRPLNERILSEDFIFELRRRYRESRKGDFVVTIYAPAALKETKSENIVIQRLKKHFRHRFLQRQKEIIRIRIRGIIFVLMGICFLTFLTLLAYFKIISNLAIEILGIVVMPLGWFGIWEGFSKIVDTSPKYLKEETLFNKLSKAQYNIKFIEE
ncbi:MAG: hypothetical protein ABIA97_04150 [Candidatus Omnitrophota bacterium]